MSTAGDIHDQGDSQSTFATTHWTVVLDAGRAGSADAARALEELCRAYWYPLYAYVRRQGRDSHDAQDLVQEFFARFLERNHVRLADPVRGRFRTFLLTSLKHFLINEWKQANRQKRGAGQVPVSWDELQAESRFAAEPAVAHSPDSHYDRVWAATLLERALMTLSAEFERAGKRDLFERLKAYAWGERSAISYATMAEELGMTVNAVRVAVHRLRQRYGELLRAEITPTVSTPVEVDEELRYLVSVVRDGLANSGNVNTQML